MNATFRSIAGQFDYWRNATMPAPLTDGSITRVVIGCGTSYNLALGVASALNSAGLRAMAVPAGEWLVRPGAYLPPDVKNIEVIALSRSGETTETVEAAKSNRSLGHRVIGITCEPGSSLSKASDQAIEFATHPEEGIVMTASASLMLLAGYALGGLAVDSTLTERAASLLAGFDAIPVSAYSKFKHFVFLGGGANYGLALEGSLKLQEMAICYTQGFHPGEYRHGPVSLVDENTAVVMIYHPDTAADEAILVKELMAKGAWVLGLGGPGNATLNVASPGDLSGAEVLPLLQMLGERFAQSRGIDTTAPRHLTKVVMLDA